MLTRCPLNSYTISSHSFSTDIRASNLVISSLSRPSSSSFHNQISKLTCTDVTAGSTLDHHCKGINALDSVFNDPEAAEDDDAEDDVERVITVYESVSLFTVPHSCREQTDNRTLRHPSRVTKLLARILTTVAAADPASM